MLGWKCPGLKLRSGEVLCYYLLDDYLQGLHRHPERRGAASRRVEELPHVLSSNGSRVFLAELSGKEAEETTGRGYSG